MVKDGWGPGKDPQAVPGGTGTVTANGELNAAGHRVPVGRRRGGESTKGKVEYWYTESTVWVQWPDGGQKMATYPRPTFTRPSVVDGWPQDLDPQATHGTGTVAANGVLGVAGHRVSVGQLCGGKSTQGKVEYWYTESRVWVRWREPDASGRPRRVMVVFPRPAFAKPSVVDGWGPGGKDPQAVPGEGTVGANGQLSVGGHRVSVGAVRGEKKESTAGKVDYWYTETTVWMQWQEPDASGQPRRVMATYPRPTLSNPSVVDNWDEDIDPRATPGTGTVTANGVLNVAGHKVSVGTRRGEEKVSTQGAVDYWYTASRVWVRWQEPDASGQPRRVMVGFPRPTLKWAAGRGGGGPGGQAVSRPAVGGDAATTVLLAWTEPFSSVSTEQRDARPAEPRPGGEGWSYLRRSVRGITSGSALARPVRGRGAADPDSGAIGSPVGSASSWSAPHAVIRVVHEWVTGQSLV
ncbi:hypothetical protein ABZ591_35780, partial [Micromonospora fulviviridis]|uniref:hypothetical protein n=1 Tax=Micromonospora fulviviridis TaxID=47860 RepID=UPI0033ED3882